MKISQSSRLLIKALLISTTIVLSLILITTTAFSKGGELTKNGYYTGKTLVKHDDGSYHMVDGENLVFFHRVENPETKFKATLGWEVPVSARKFNLTDEELVGANVYYHIECAACAERGFHSLQRGTISGNSGIFGLGPYSVNVDVVLTGAHGRNIKIQFWENFNRIR